MDRLQNDVLFVVVQLQAPIINLLGDDQGEGCGLIACRSSGGCCGGGRRCHHGDQLSPDGGPQDTRSAAYHSSNKDDREQHQEKHAFQSMLQ